MSSLQNNLLKGLIDEDINTYTMDELIDYLIDNDIVFDNEKELDKDKKSKQIKFSANITELVKRIKIVMSKLFKKYYK
ncbi:28400_t:CDS:1, partial [Dentiscutata erythropus]